MDSRISESLSLVLQNKIFATTLAITVPTLAYMILSYRQYVSFGKHGLSPTLGGYWHQLKWHRIARRDTTEPAPYSDLLRYGPECWKSYLPDEYALPPRRGSRPNVPTFCAPQRQTDQLPSTSIVAAQHAFLTSVATEHPSLFECRTSFIEKVGPALFISEKRQMRDLFRIGNGEFGHVHPEGSTHLFLSLVDAETVIEKGWGQRHKLTGPMIPWGYTLIYGPRDQEEFETWKEIVKAAVEYFTY